MRLRSGPAGLAAEKRGPEEQTQPSQAAALPGCRHARSVARRAEPPGRRVGQAREDAAGEAPHLAALLALGTGSSLSDG